MFNIGGSEMIVLGILALLVFGPEGLPGIIKNVMRTVNAVKAAARDFQTEVSTVLNEEHERQDLAKRQRKAFVDPEDEKASPPSQIQIGVAGEPVKELPAADTEEPSNTKEPAEPAVEVSTSVEADSDDDDIEES